MKPAVHGDIALAQCEASYAQAHSLSLLRGLTLHERERIAYANGERETHALILAAELGAEDVAADYIEEVDNDTALLADAKETAARLDAANAEIRQLQTELGKARQLRDAARRAVSPYFPRAYVGDYNTLAPRAKPAPKWSAYLVAALIRSEKS